MGAFTAPALPFAAGPAVAGTTATTSSMLPAILGAASQGANFVHQRAQANAQIKAAQAQTHHAIQLEQRRQAIAERRKRESLKLAKARHRAGFGASGIGASGGSAAAVLSGLQKRAEQDIADERFVSNSRILDMNNRLAATRAQQRNLLDASNPLRRIVIDEVERGFPRTQSLLGD